MKNLAVLTILIITGFGFTIFGLNKNPILSPLAQSSLFSNPLPPPPEPVPTPSPEPSLLPSPSPIPSPIPSPDPKLYGPCRLIPVVVYHHIQSQEEATAKGQKNISVDSSIFANQMAYLVSRGYNSLTPDQFLENVTTGSSGRSILLTFDDGYEDFYKYAYPELVKNGLRATVFVSTGLIGNPDYLTWGQIGEMKGSGLITFSNHTWSHKNLGKASDETIRYEIETAKKQLEERGLGPVTSFAYPYGSQNSKVQKVLAELGVKSAFTTVSGSYQCAKLPYEFMRRRIGNSTLSSYGL